MSDRPTSERTFLARIWSSTYSKYYLLAALVAVTIANLLDVRIVGIGPLDANAAAAIGTWFSGMLTVITIAIAAQTFRHDRLRADEVAKREAVGALERQRVAAGAIFAWLKIIWDDVIDVPKALSLNFSNQTSVPIYQWKLLVEGCPHLECNSSLLGPILPGNYEIPLSDEDWVRLARTGKIHRVALEFKGLSGETLRRGFDGALTVIAPSDELNA